jgi:exonuclease III
MQSLQTNMPNEQNLLLPKMSGFKLASLNVTSLVKHIEELRILLANNMIDVLAINETRLDSTVSDDEVHIHGYEIVRRDRESNGRFGGGFGLA